VAEFPKGWYPSPNVAGRDQWWNGSAWTPHTQLSDGGFAQAGAVPPAGDIRPGVGNATLSTAFIALAIGLLSLFFNPVFVFSFVALLLGGAAVASVRGMPPLGIRAAVLIVGITAIALSVAGAVVLAASLF
jgi:hypothetical protein